MDRSYFGDPVPPPSEPSGWVFEDILSYFPQIGTVLVRADVAREVGPLDETLTGDSEWDWNLRIARHSQIGRVAEPVLLFRQRGTAEEALMWRRWPSTVVIFKRHTASLPLLQRLRLRPKLWRHRGFYAGVFLWFAEMNWEAGRRRRALHSVLYAFGCSPPHAVVGLTRLAGRRVHRQ